MGGGRRAGLACRGELRLILSQLAVRGVAPTPTTEHRPPATAMSMDKSLKRKGGMARNRCVLKRSERILKMLEEGKFPDGRSPFGLPKTRVQKVVLKKKPKKEETAAAGEAGAPG